MNRIRINGITFDPQEKTAVALAAAPLAADAAGSNWMISLSGKEKMRSWHSYCRSLTERHSGIDALTLRVRPLDGGIALCCLGAVELLCSSPEPKCIGASEYLFRINYDLPPSRSPDWIAEV
jgi:hypothetical protein